MRLPKIWLSVFALLAIFLVLASYGSPGLRTVSRGLATIMILASVFIILVQLFFPGQRLVGMIRTGFTSTYAPFTPMIWSRSKIPLTA